MVKAYVRLISQRSQTPLHRMSRRVCCRSKSCPRTMAKNSHASLWILGFLTAPLKTIEESASHVRIISSARNFARSRFCWANISSFCFSAHSALCCSLVPLTFPVYRIISTSYMPHALPLLSIFFHSLSSFFIDFDDTSERAKKARKAKLMKSSGKYPLKQKTRRGSIFFVLFFIFLFVFLSIW